MGGGGERADLGSDAAGSGGESAHVGSDALPSGGESAHVGSDAAPSGGESAHVGSDAAPSGEEDPRLARLSAVCSELPEAERSLSPPHAGFRVRGRTFAYYLDNHRGDEGIVGVVFKAAGGLAEGLIGADPERFYRPAYLGHRGWVGLRLDRGEIDWAEVAGFVADSYVLVAPKRLAAQVAG